jgi:hypothetical protein
VVVLLSLTPAHAYVRSVNSNGTQVRWPTSCIVMSPDARGDQSSDDIDIAAFEDALGRAVGNWNARISSCSFMKLGVTNASIALEAVADGRPAVVFRSDMWGKNGMMYDDAAIGLTTVWSADRDGDITDGQISDADIELNAVNFSFSTTPGSGTARNGTKLEDLENTLTHELGHVLGLAHTCWDHKTRVHDMVIQPVDNTGALIPDCSSGTLPDLVTKATMYPFSPPDSTAMRNLSDDDVRGVCDVYPSTDTATACYGYIEGRGCSESEVRWPGTETAGWVSLATAAASILVLLLTRRRRGIRRS